jgi:glycosyltransferase involved in cell wall biosynthesis
LKICHLITSIDRGGAENHLISLIKKQNKSSEILLIYLRGNDYWKKELETMGVKVVKIKFLKLINIIRLIKVYIELKKIILNFNPDIVHAHLSSMELLASLLKFFNPKEINLVITKHLDSFFLEASFGQNLLIRGVFIDKFIHKNADRIICISKQVKRYFTKKILLPTNKIRVIYYGVSKEYFGKKKKFKLIDKNLNKKDFLICCIARHVKQKSLDFLILSFAEFTKKNPNSKLLLVGNGPERNNLIKIAKENKVYKKIIWIKFSENIKDLLKISNVFVLPSKYEGFGMVFLEAMLTNTPVISTNISAIPEVIENNYNGILIEPDNIKQMVSALNNIQDKKLIKKFSINSKKLLSNKFNLEAMYKKTNNVYYSILNI